MKIQIKSNISTNKACEDEGLELSTNLNGTFLWSNGEKTQNIYPSKSGIYSLKFKYFILYSIFRKFCL